MVTKLKLVFFALAACFIAYTIYLSAFFVLQGEVHITNDIGRDFLLLDELADKKIVLIGARSNVLGVFHGPLWTYMNYPAYVLGGGNPITIAWFWVGLGVVFLLTTFLILKKMFDTTTAVLITALLSVDLIAHANSVFGQQAAFYFMPLFLFSIYQYFETKRAYYLALHMVTMGIFIHMNIGVGGLFALLSLLLCAWFILKNKLWKHSMLFMILPIVTLNFILFDMRHEFTIIRALLHLGGSSPLLLPLSDIIQNRFNTITSFQIFTPTSNPLALWIFLLVMGCTLWKIKQDSKEKSFLLLLLYYYFGYLLLSFVNKGVLLVDYVYLLIPLTAFWLGALMWGKYKFIFIPICLLIMAINFSNAQAFLTSSQESFIGKSADSWIAMRIVASSIIAQEQTNPFGYYVYSPDAFAYQQRYGMNYAFRSAKAQALEYRKNPTTYVISAPPPVDDPYVSGEWWVVNKAKINAKPVQKEVFPSGYTFEKFQLSASEQTIAHDPTIELGLHFR